MGYFLTSEAAGAYLFIFNPEEIPCRMGSSAVFSGFALVISVPGGVFFKENSEQGWFSGGSTNPCHKKSSLD